MIILMHRWLELKSVPLKLFNHQIIRVGHELSDGWKVSKALISILITDASKWSFLSAQRLVSSIVCQCNAPLLVSKPADDELLMRILGCKATYNSHCFMMCNLCFQCKSYEHDVLSHKTLSKMKSCIIVCKVLSTLISGFFPEFCELENCNLIRIQFWNTSYRSYEGLFLPRLNNIKVF